VRKSSNFHLVIYRNVILGRNIGFGLLETRIQTYNFFLLDLQVDFRFLSGLGSIGRYYQFIMNFH